MCLKVLLKNRNLPGSRKLRNWSLLLGSEYKLLLWKRTESFQILPLLISFLRRFLKNSRELLITYNTYGYIRGLPYRCAQSVNVPVFCPWFHSCFLYLVPPLHTSSHIWSYKHFFLSKLQWCCSALHSSQSRVNKLHSCKSSLPKSTIHKRYEFNMKIGLKTDW